MAKRVSPTFVGAFVLGAAGLLIGALMVFSGEQFASDKLSYTMYFEGSVKGLNVGAPVTFRGVKLGTVTNVQVSRVAGSDEIRVPVTVKLFASRVESDNSYWNFNRGEVEQYLEELVADGLRASLGLQSFVTGQLYVAMEFETDPEPAQIELRDGTRIFPTVRSRFNQIAEEVQELPIKDIVNQALIALQGISRVINSDDLDNSMRAIHGSAVGLEQLIGKLDKELVPTIQDTAVSLERLIGKLDKELVPTIKQMSVAAGNANQLFINSDRLVQESSGDVKAILDDMQKTLKKSKKTLDAYQSLTTKESVVGSELVKALREMSAASRSIRIMAEYLERHPEALLKGKAGR